MKVVVPWSLYGFRSSVAESYDLEGVPFGTAAVGAVAILGSRPILFGANELQPCFSPFVTNPRVVDSGTEVHGSSTAFQLYVFVIPQRTFYFCNIYVSNKLHSVFSYISDTSLTSRNFYRYRHYDRNQHSFRHRLICEPIVTVSQEGFHR